MVFNARLKVLATSATKSPLTLEKAKAWVLPKGHDAMPGMKHLIEANVSVAAGEFTLAGGTPIWLIAAIAGGLLLLLLVIVVARCRARRPAGAAWVPAPAAVAAPPGANFCNECGRPLGASDKFYVGCGTRAPAPVA